MSIFAKQPFEAGLVDDVGIGDTNDNVIDVITKGNLEAANDFEEFKVAAKIILLNNSKSIGIVMTVAQKFKNSRNGKVLAGRLVKLREKLRSAPSDGHDVEIRKAFNKV